MKKLFLIDFKLHKQLLIILCLLYATQSFAADDAINWPGEMAHAAGGAVLAGVATAVANKYWSEHRTLIGFSFSTVCGIIGELSDRITYGEKFSSSFQDVAFHTLGAAIGSLITDKFILMPVVERDHARAAYYGLAIQYYF